MTAAKPYLTLPEREVLLLVAEGYTYAEIAPLLGIKRGTAQDRMTRVGRRLRAKNATHAVWLAAQHSLIDPHAGVVA